MYRVCFHLDVNVRDGKGNENGAVPVISEWMPTDSKIGNPVFGLKRNAMVY